MTRPLLALVAAVGTIGLLAGGLAWLFDPARPAAGATRGERLYVAYCVHCHGEDGRGSWRATLFLVRPGDLSDPARMRTHSDRYLADIVKHGGSPIGRPGMPGFPQLTEQDLDELVRYLRHLSRAR